MKLEERLKSFGVLIAFISFILGVIGIEYSDPSISNDQKLKWVRWIIVLVLTLSLFIILFSEKLSNYWMSYLLKKRHLKGVVISKRTTEIVITDDDGKNATILQKMRFSMIKDGDFICKINSDASEPNSYIDISKMQVANCSYHLTPDKKCLKMFFGNHDGSHNKKRSLFHVEKFIYFSSELINSFLNTEQDEWTMSTSNYCKEYEVKITFPPNRKIKSANFQDKNGKLERTSPIVISENSRDVIYLMIINFDTNKNYKLHWTYIEKR